MPGGRRQPDRFFQSNRDAQPTDACLAAHDGWIEGDSRQPFHSPLSCSVMEGSSRSRRSGSPGHDLDVPHKFALSSFP